MTRVVSIQGRHSFDQTVRRLSEASVRKHFDAYGDVAWEAPSHAIDPTDPRWEKSSDDPLGATAWYRGLPQPVRARLGLHHVVTQMKMGVEFESVLSRGLLEFASTLPNGSPEFRYAYHEVLEEGQHSLMFQEFVNRSGLDVTGLGRAEAFVSRRVPALGRRFPELFFLFVLGGEAPIDHVQRRELASKRDMHPLLRRVMQIHVTEEARHLCFASGFLRDRVPRLGWFARRRLEIAAPFVLAPMAQAMLRPPRHLVREYGIPARVVAEAYGSARHRERSRESLEPVAALCHELGLITPTMEPIWRGLGVAPVALDRVRPAQVPAPVPGVVRGVPREWLRTQAA